MLDVLLGNHRKLVVSEALLGLHDGHDIVPVLEVIQLRYTLLNVFFVENYVVLISKAHPSDQMQVICSLAEVGGLVIFIEFF